MGVPKFYRWLSERYPCLSEVVKEHQIPDFDNLYLDMNGIVHICSHPNDDDPHFRITEEKIFESIFHYIEVLFRMIRPRKVFFLAIDGVAPRAKMNQQRGRRFRSAKEAEMNEKRAKDRGEVLPKEARFDSNCITPGTPFMVRLQNQLRFFISNKISTDPLWQSVRVILSGHETPGEGEHKIMDFIRYEKSQDGYDPNIRHCLYGLDADLVMLGMCTHDPHFSLLREEVRFGGKKSATRRMPTPEETTFHLLHLSLLREYLEHEFSDVKSRIPFQFDLEGIIDDWILLGFLVGNDFIPHLPHLHINKGALHDLFNTYKAILPALGGYLNIGGFLNLERFEKFLKLLSEKEMDRFDDIYSDSKWLEGKTAEKKSGGRHTVKPTPGPANVYEILQGKPEPNVSTSDDVLSKDEDLKKLLTSADEYLHSEDDTTQDDGDDQSLTDTDVGTSDSRDSFYHMEFRQHKRDYYIQKMGYEKVDASVLQEQAECYVRAIQWNLHYYYNGCASWSWYYPHHFAPWITDIKDFANMEMNFEMSTPFLPFEQLMAVLPAASKELLPPLLQGLMINETSPIIDYYPPDFECDMNGKQQEWEAVVLIPFIDEKRLLDAMAPLLPHLRPDEKARNVHGPMQVFTYTAQDLGLYESPGFFPPISNNHAQLLEVWRKEWLVPIHSLKKGLMRGVKLDVFFPGFPTLKHIPHEPRLKAGGVRVFEQASRGENMMLVIQEQGNPSTKEVAEEMLGQEIWVSWPHMVEAKVFEVMDREFAYSLSHNGGKVVADKLEDRRKGEFEIQVKATADRYKTRWGIDVGKTKVLLQACLMTGRKYVCGFQGRVTLEKQWSKTRQPFALQTTRKDILVHDPTFTQYRTLAELYPVGSTCFMLGQPNYGCQGDVLKIASEHKGRIQLSFVEPQDADLAKVVKMKNELAQQYYPGYKIAQMCGISSHIVSRITGTILVSKSAKEADPDRQSRINVGLNLKFNKKNEEVSGFSKKSNDGTWLYSQKVVEIIMNYMSKFPQIFDYLSRNGHENASKDMFHMTDVFDKEDPLETLMELSNWLKESPSSTATKQTCGTLTLDEGIVEAIEKVIDGTDWEEKKKLITMQVRPHLLFKPNLCQGSTMPDENAKFNLFDRVVNVREGYSVPLGLRGTITGIHAASAMENKSFDVLFDKSFPGGLSIRSSPGRSYRVPASALICLSYGAKLNQHHGNQTQMTKNQKPTAFVSPMDSRQEKNFDTAPAFTKQPPDPKNLPVPTSLLGKKTTKQPLKKSYQAAAAGASSGTLPVKNDSFNDLWKNLQQPPPAHFEEPQAPPTSGDTQGLSQDLKNLLQIKNPPQDPESTVQQFFQAAAGVVPTPVVADSDGNSCKELLDLMESKRLGLPRYKFTADHRQINLFVELALPWGPTFEASGPIPKRDELAEMCARQAIKHLKENGFPPQNVLVGVPLEKKDSFKKFVPMQVNKRKVVASKPKAAAEATDSKPKEQNPKANPRVQQWVNQQPEGGVRPKTGSNNPPKREEQQPQKKNMPHDPTSDEFVEEKGEKKKKNQRRGRIAANFNRQ